MMKLLVVFFNAGGEVEDVGKSKLNAVSIRRQHVSGPVRMIFGHLHSVASLHARSACCPALSKGHMIQHVAYASLNG